MFNEFSRFFLIKSITNKMSLSSHFRKLVPTLNRVLVKKLEPVSKTKSGIILSTKEESPNVGVVISTGEGVFDNNGNKIPLSVNVGHKVLLPDFGGSKIELGDGEFFLYRDSEILGILEEQTQ